MRPNIVFYFTDQQRFDTCGIYGQRLPVTPRLDAFAARSVCFEQAITCQPVCGPARAALQTGRWPAAIGCATNGLPLPQDMPTLARAFHQAGYLTAYCGKWHLASRDGVENYQTLPIPPERRGGWTDYWVASDVLEFTSHGYGGYMYRGDGSKYEFTGYRTDGVTDAALEFLRGERDRSRPFFLFLSHIEPHHQNDHDRYEGPVDARERWKDYDVPGDLQGTQGNWRENYPDYLGCCNKCDENFGRVLDALAESGEIENTLVVYTSDHGSHFCTRNGEYKRSCHEGCAHVPLVIGGPGFTGGKRIGHVVSLMDLPITLLTAAGIAPLPEMAGRPLQQAVSGAPWEDVAYMQISESHLGRAVRTDRWKYAVGAPGYDAWRDAYAPEYMECFLYDLQNDPYEKRNLVDDPAYGEVRAQLRKLLLRQMGAAGEPEARIVEFYDPAYLQAISAPRVFKSREGGV